MRAPTPSAAAELAVWSKEEFLSKVYHHIIREASLLQKQARLAREGLLALLARPVFNRPLELIYQRQQSVDGCLRLLNIAGKNLFDNYKNRLSLGLSRLETLSPLGVLARGYSVTRLIPSNKLVKTVESIKQGNRLESSFGDGSAISVVEEIRKGKNFGGKKTV